MLPGEEVRLVVLGEGGVGKSSLVLQFIMNEFIDEYDPTIEDSYRKMCSVDEEECLLDILDTAGEEEFTCFQDQYLRQGHGFLVLVCPHSKFSLDEVPSIIERLARAKDVLEYDELNWVLVSTKHDLPKDEIEVTREAVLDVAAEYHAKAYIESSSLKRWNVDECFDEIVRAVRTMNTSPIVHAPRQSKWSKLNPFKWSWSKKKKKLTKRFTGSGSSPLQRTPPRLPKTEIEVEIESDFTPLERAASGVWDDLLAIFNTKGTAGDVLIEMMEGKVIIAHKVKISDVLSMLTRIVQLVLSIRSPVFSRMFSNPAVTKVTGDSLTHLNLSHHLCFPAVLAMIRFCYKPLLLEEDKPYLDELKKLNEEYKIEELEEVLPQSVEKRAGFSLESSVAIQTQMAPSLKAYHHLSDVCFEVEGKKFHLHKCLLFARCKWFKGLLSGGFSEQITAGSIIEIDSMDSQTFGLVVEYLYTGRVMDLGPDQAVNLLSAANMLNLKRLTHISEQALQPLLDPENVIAVYQAAEFHNASQLMDNCIHIMVQEYEEVSALPEFHAELPEDLASSVRTKYERYKTAKREREEREGCLIHNSSFNSPIC